MNFRLVLIGCIVAGTVAQPLSAVACPFCRPVKTTFTEDINAADVAALAELIHRPERPDPGEGDIPAAEIIESYRATFRIVKIYSGGEYVKVGQKVVAIYSGDAGEGAMCLMRGVQPDDLQWAPPLPLSKRAQHYVDEVLNLPQTGGERLLFFEDYLEDSDDTLRNDAFDEFARADYAAIVAIKDRIDHDRLMGWIQNPAVVTSNRRLYFTMLSVCARPGDEQILNEMIVSGGKEQLRGLDALIACYLTLVGPEGMPLIEDRFLRGGIFWDPEYAETYAAIMALRFHGQESSVIPKERLVAALRIVLERPQLADIVIPDLARWEDWNAMDRLVQMFKEVDKKSRYVRVPIVNYLRACPLPEAKQHLTELAKIDPDAIRRASTFFPFAGRASTSNEKDAAGDEKKAATEEAKEVNETKATGEDSSAERKSPPSPATETGMGPSSAEAQTTDASAVSPPQPYADVLLGIGRVVGVSSLAAVFLFCLMWVVLRPPAQPNSDSAI